MAHTAQNPRNPSARMPILRKASGIALMMMVAASLRAGDIGQSPVESSPRRIVVSIPDRKLALVEGGEVRKVYDVGVGARVSPSPTGQFKIINRIVKPSYHHTGKVVPPGKSNPLGTRWLGLSKASYGIHGTNVPKSIGKAASHGCIRMRNSDVEELFEMVRPGDEVEIVAEPEESVAQLFHHGQTKTIAATQAVPVVVVAALAGEF